MRQKAPEVGELSPRAILNEGHIAPWGAQAQLKGNSKCENQEFINKLPYRI